MRLFKSFLAASVLSLSLSACATFGDTPQEQLNGAKFAFNTAVAVYNTICAGRSAPTSCTDPKSVAAENSAKDLFENALAAAQASIDAGKPDKDALVAATLSAVVIIENLVADLREQQATKPATQ